MPKTIICDSGTKQLMCGIIIFVEKSKTEQETAEMVETKIYVGMNDSVEKKPVVEEIAKDLCVFFHQESVLITEGRVNAYYISESLE